MFFVIWPVVFGARWFCFFYMSISACMLWLFLGCILGCFLLFGFDLNDLKLMFLLLGNFSSIFCINPWFWVLLSPSMCFPEILLGILSIFCSAILTLQNKNFHVSRIIIFVFKLDHQFYIFWVYMKFGQFLFGFSLSRL